MTRLDAYVAGIGTAVGFRLVYKAVTGPPCAFESWLWRTFEGGH